MENNLKVSMVNDYVDDTWGHFPCLLQATGNNQVFIASKHWSGKHMEKLSIVLICIGYITSENVFWQRQVGMTLIFEDEGRLWRNYHKLPSSYKFTLNN